MARNEAKWSETDRQPIGFHVGRGRGGALPWFSILCRVTEVKRHRGKVLEYRERFTYGKLLNGATHGDPALARLISMVVDGVDTLSRYADAEDGKATSRRKRG